MGVHQIEGGSDAFVRYERYRQVAEVQQPEAFIVRSALNASIDVARRDKRRPTCGPVPEDFPDKTAGPSEVYEARQRLAKLRVAVSRLNPRARRMLLASRLDGLSYAAIAEREGITVSGVEKSIGRSLETLTEFMDGM